MSKVTGFDELQKQLEDLSVNAKNLDELISAKTDFDNWEELIEEATAEYVYKQLELL